MAEAMHEATGQHLCAAELALKRLQLIAEPEVSAAHEGIGEALDDAKESLQKIRREISVLTYLLRPPVFDSHSMSEALRIFGEGFERKSGIAAEVRPAPETDELPVMIFMPLFRVLQEALANVHRHARAAKVIVELDVEDGEVVLTVADDGVGFDSRTGPRDQSDGVRTGSNARSNGSAEWDPGGEQGRAGHHDRCQGALGRLQGMNWLGEPESRPARLSPYPGGFHMFMGAIFTHQAKDEFRIIAAVPPAGNIVAAE